MDEKYFEKLGFSDDVYQIKDPESIPFKYITWNRNDLKELKQKLDSFISLIGQGITTGAKIFGAWGSGKTWLIRYIEKIASEKDEIITLYGKVDTTDVSLNGFYRTIIENILLEKRVIIKEKIQKHLDKPELKEEDYKKIFSDSDLAICLFNSIQETTNKSIADRWLKGQKLVVDHVKKLNLINQNDNDYDRYRILGVIINDLSSLFSKIIFFADQLERSEPKLSRPLSDILRGYLDKFMNFILVVSYVSEEEDPWYDLGFTDTLSSRIKHSFLLKSIDSDDIMIDFFKIHHKLYGVDTIKPFTEEALKHLWNILELERRYPRFIFVCAQLLANQLVVSGESEITPDFIDKNKVLIEEHIAKE